MASFLKGNYKLSKRRKTRAPKPVAKNLTDQFEEQTLAKLGGSLCFVMKRKAFLWSGDSHDAAR